MALRYRQQRFVEEYLIDFNASAAYRRAGYHPQTDHAAEVAASRLLKNVEVLQAIAAGRAQQSQNAEMSAGEVISRLTNIARSSPADYGSWGPDGVQLLPSAQLRPEQAACIAELSESKDGRIRYKLESRIRALELLGKHYGLFPDKLQVEGGSSLPVVVELIDHAHRNGRAPEGATPCRTNGVLPQ